MKSVKLKIKHGIRSLGRKLKIKNLVVDEPKEEPKEQEDGRSK